MQVEFGVLMPLIGAVAGIAGSYATTALRAKKYDTHEQRLDECEKEMIKMLSRPEAEMIFVTKLEFNLRIKNVEDHLVHIEADQKEILKILRQGAKNG